MTTTTRTITLTNRAPVKINDDQWPIVAESSWHDGQIRQQANRSCWLKVRQHADGRALVYGAYDSAYPDGRALVYGAYDSAYPDGRDRRGGELLAAGSDVAAAINRVAATCNATECAAACIADLPAEEI